MTCMFFNAHFKISVKLIILISIYISHKEKLLCSGIFVLTKAKKKKKSFKFMLTYKALVPMHVLTDDFSHPWVQSCDHALHGALKNVKTYN